MKFRLKSWSLITNIFKIQTKKALIVGFLCFFISAQSQIANYVSNGGFENYWSCSFPNNLLLPIAWRTIDSLTDPSRYYNSCTGIQNVPLEGGYLQWPRSGSAFISITPYCSNGACTPNFNRSYARNRLKSSLVSGTSYCVRFFVNVRNISTVGIDAISICFTDNFTLDTIQNKNRQLTFLTPQIQNPVGNIITDTLNWIEIAGTFIAIGNESHLLIGNFKSDVATQTLQISPGSIYETDLFIDDVSCIPLDLPAYAYSSNNAYAIPGNTLYLGRQQDVGIDEACMWYKLPNTSTAIDTAAGITITVAATTETYVVKQEICAGIKYDTVLVHPSALGIEELKMLNDEWGIMPNPASDEIQIINAGLNRNNSFTVTITNSIGQTVVEEKFINPGPLKLNVASLPQGVFYVGIFSSGYQHVFKKLVITR